MTPPPPQVVLLAGGLGTRLGALTRHVPKVMVPVAGRPFLDHLLTSLAAQRIERVHLCLGHLADVVVEHLSRHCPAGLSWSTTVEDVPLGTAGALRLAASRLDQEFVVMLGDSLTPVRLGELVGRHRAAGREASMAVLRNDDWLVPSNTLVEGDRVAGYSKQPGGGMRHVDYGLAVLRRSSLDQFELGRSADLGELFAPLVAAGELTALPVSRRFYEIGSPTGRDELERLLLGGAPPHPSTEFEEFSDVQTWQRPGHQDPHLQSHGVRVAVDAGA